MSKWETLVHDTGTGSGAHEKQHGCFNFHTSSGFLRAHLKDPCSINCLVVKHSYHRRMKSSLCSANVQTFWFQDVCSDLRFRPLKLSPLAVTTLNWSRQLKQWHCNLTLFRARKSQFKKSYLFQQPFLFQWCIILQAIGVRERKYPRKSELSTFGNEWSFIFLVYPNSEVKSFLYSPRKYFKMANFDVIDFFFQEIPYKKNRHFLIKSYIKTRKNPLNSSHCLAYAHFLHVILIFAFLYYAFLFLTHS